MINNKQIYLYIQSLIFSSYLWNILEYFDRLKVQKLYKIVKV